MISFSRNLTTGDSHDIAINDSTIYLLYAYAPTDGDVNNNYAQHSVRGVGTVNFMSGNVTASNDTVQTNVTVTTTNSTGNSKF